MNMKAIVEIPDRMLDVMRGLMMMSVNRDSEEQEMDEAIQKLKEMKDPIQIDMSEKSDFFGNDLTKAKKEFSLAIASFAICQVIKDMER